MKNHLYVFTKFIVVFTALTALCQVTVHQPLTVVQALDDCRPNRLAQYRMIFHTNWNRELFPRQYPEWRPPAQWSKVVGK